MNQFEALFHLSLDLQCVANQEGYLVMVNPAWERTLGWPASVLCNRPFLEFVHPDDRESTLGVVQRQQAGESIVAFENRYLHRDGSYRWLNWNSQLSAETGLLYATARDVTEARRQQIMHRQIQEDAAVGSWEVDLDTEQVYWSEITHRIHGTDPDSYRPSLNDALSFYPPEARALLEPAVAELMRKGAPYYLDLPFDTVDGKRIWVSATAHAEYQRDRLVKVYGTFHDISREVRQRRTREALSKLQNVVIQTRVPFQQSLGVLLDELRTATDSREITLMADPVMTGSLQCLAGPASCDLFPRLATHQAQLIEVLQSEQARNYGVQLMPLEEGDRPGSLALLAIRFSEQITAWLGFYGRPGGYGADELAGYGRILESLGLLIDANRERELFRSSQKLLQRLSKVARETTNSVVITDAEGLTVWVNEGFTRLTGYSEEDILGRKPGHLLQGPSTDPTTVAKIRLALLREQGFEVELINYTRDGKEYWINILCNPMFDDDGNLEGFMAIESDITDQKIAWEALRYERALFSAGPVFTIEWSPGTGWPVRYVSENIRQVLGYSVEEMKHPDFRYSELIHPDEREQVTAEVLYNSDHGIDIYEQNYRLKVREGIYRWFYDFTTLVRDSAGEVVAIQGYLYDNTRQREQEQQIREERQRLDYILEGTHVGTWEWNIQTGEVVFNERWAEIIGYTLQELQPTSIETWSAYAHPDDLALSGELLQKHFKGETDYYDFECRMRHRSGHWVWVQDRGKVSSWTESGKPLWMYGTHQDITERKRLETLKSEFVATVSHELRTPLTSISGALALLLGGVAGGVSDSARDLLQIARSNSERLTVLINDLLDIEKLAAGQMNFDMHVMPLCPVITRAIRDAETIAFQTDVRIRCDIGVQVCVNADEQRLLQVLSNLLSNAIKFSPPGEEVRVLLEPLGAEVKVSIRDHGPGVPESFRQHLFQRFSQADSSDRREKGGTGLGLAISSELVRAMGGQIGYEPAPGGGSIFCITLPLSDAV